MLVGGLLIYILLAIIRRSKCSLLFSVALCCLGFTLVLQVSFLFSLPDVVVVMDPSIYVGMSLSCFGLLIKNNDLKA